MHTSKFPQTYTCLHTVMCCGNDETAYMFSYTRVNTCFCNFAPFNPGTQTPDGRILHGRSFLPCEIASLEGVGLVWAVLCFLNKLILPSAFP
ncbi:hypothetical protein FKM82_026273 [Ascaphus truei]